MSHVVLRCPNCGTTRPTPGECEACHESQVRYYCTNHAPGRWLDTPACSQCGARFGEAQRPAVAPVATPSRIPTAAPRLRPVPAERPRTDALPRDVRERAPTETEETIDPRKARGERAARVTGWEELRRAAASARRRLPADAEAGFKAPGRRPGGCLLRFMLIVVFLFFMLASGLFVFGASLVQMFLRH